MSPPVVEFQSAIKSYGQKKIGPVEFSIEKGEIFGFLGPNGSGKTTCIRMLLGLVKPSGGKVRLRGLDPLRRHVEALTGVGYSMELPNIQTFLSPREVLNLAAAEVGLKNSSAEIDRVLEEVGILEYGDVKVGKLSKGMVQRLSVALAMLGNPEVMVMDEPMIGLDPAGTAHLREVFRSFAGQGGTILMSSHMMSEVEDLCSSIGLIHSGKILFLGTPKEMVVRMLGVDEIRVEVRKLSPGAIDLLRKIHGVLAIKESDGKLEFAVSEGVEVRPEIAKIIVESGAELLAISEGERLLERAYIEALKNGGNKTE